MSEEILAKESEEGTEQEDSSDILEESTETEDVTLDQILEYAYDQGIEADKVDEWIAENFIVEEDDEDLFMDEEGGEDGEGGEAPAKDDASSDAGESADSK